MPYPESYQTDRSGTVPDGTCKTTTGKGDQPLARSGKTVYVNLPEKDYEQVRKIVFTNNIPSLNAYMCALVGEDLQRRREAKRRTAAARKAAKTRKTNQESAGAAGKENPAS